MGWNTRALEYVEWRGEKFYTVTPLPFYVKRRELFYSLVEPFVANASGPFLDVGCGDGYWLDRIARIRPDVMCVGYDPFPGMIALARQRRPDMQWVTDLQDLSTSGPQFGFVIITAVLAHLSDNDVMRLMDQVRQLLKSPASAVLIFEQTGPQTTHGASWSRRTPTLYRKLFEVTGFGVESEKHIAFPAYEFYAKSLLPVINFPRRRLLDRSTLSANHSRFLRLVSAFILAMTRNPLHHRAGEYRGNTLWVLRLLPEIANQPNEST